MTKNKIAKKTTQKLSILKSESLGWFFGSLSFIADAYTIVQIFNNNQKITHFSAGLSLIIWLLAIFTYFSLLHRHWLRIRRNSGFSESFIGYFFRDLIFYFKEPFCLFPFIALLVLLFPIFYTTSITIFYALLFVLLLSFLLLVIIKLSEIMVRFTESSAYGMIDEKTKKEIKLNWRKLESRVSLELSSRMIVSKDHFTEIKSLYNYDDAEFSYIFALYASRHPDLVRYGNLFRYSEEDAKDVELVSMNCLANILIFKDKHFVMV